MTRSSRIFLMLGAALLFGVNAARADQWRPIQAETITLGPMTGVAYYTTAPDGAHLVATLSPAEGGTPLRVQFNQGDNPFAEPEERKQGEGIVSMRRRKTAERASLNARRNEEQGRKAGKQPGVVASARNVRKKPAVKK